MSQTSIASYFATRKRPAADDIGVIKAKKVLILDRSEASILQKEICEEVKNSTCELIYSSKEVTLNNNEAIKSTKQEISTEQEHKLLQRNKVVTKLNFDPVTSSNINMTIKRGGTPKSKPKKVIKEISNQPSIQSVFQNLQSTKNITNSQETNEKTPPTTPVKNALDKIDVSKNKDLSLNEIKNKLSRSSRLAELKASIAKFNKSADKLKEIEKKTLSKEPTGPTLKTFEKIELEVQLSPKKIVSPVKQYLSPKKDVSSPKKNLFGLLSPNKNSGTNSKTLPAYQRFQSLASPEKPSLTLPFKYRSLAEMFRSIDTVCAMMFNRKEMITFNKVKPAVQSMMRRNLTLQHFAQINTLYPDAFIFKWDKMKCFASMKETSELVIVPIVQFEATNEEGAVMNPTCLLERRRKLFNSLVEKVKDYHEEFLQSLDPPMDISRDKITRWHPEFDIEKVPDIEETDLPKQPEEEKMTTGQEVLEKARSLFSCNTRMEKALEKLKQLQEKKSVEEKETAAPTATPAPPSLKGIPKSLVEKIRAKQAAKALDAMTRSSSQDKEALMYSRLPEIARLMRNTFVAEKKGVLPLEDCIIKLNNSYRSHMTNSEIEQHLRLLSKVVPGWLIFHEIRRTLFVKLSRDGDMAKVMTRLEQLAKEKSAS